MILKLRLRELYWNLDYVADDTIRTNSPPAGVHISNKLRELYWTSDYVADDTIRTNSPPAGVHKSNKLRELYWNSDYVNYTETHSPPAEVSTKW